MRITSQIHITGFRVQRLEAPNLGAWVNLYMEARDVHGEALIELLTADDCDALIKAAVEAKRLLAPPVITCSERTCDARHPDTNDWCVREGEHAEHEDTYGQTWTTALTAVSA